MVIEVDILFDDIWQWKPHSIPFGIVEPSACLPMDVYHKVEYKLEQAKWKLDMLRSIQKRYDLGEAEDANDLQNWYYIEYLSG